MKIPASKISALTQGMFARAVADKNSDLFSNFISNFFRKFQDTSRAGTFQYQGFRSGAEGFDMQCINPRKTICDKISRLVKLSYNENANELLAKHIRDVYDLSALFHNSEYKGYLLSDEFLEAMYKVTLEDGLNKNSRPHLSLADAPIFKDTKATILQPEILATYTLIKKS